MILKKGNGSNLYSLFTFILLWRRGFGMKMKVGIYVFIQMEKNTGLLKLLQHIMTYVLFGFAFNLRERLNWNNGVGVAFGWNKNVVK